MGRLSLISATLALSLFLLTNISGCSSENSSTSASAQTPENAIYASKEFIYNYELLTYYYNDASLYLESPESYIGKLEDNALEKYEIPWDYYDIFYMYEQMHDKYTRYTDPSHAATLWTSILSSSPTMVPGFEWEKANSNEFFVTNVVKNSPADKAGIKIGDQIQAIDGVVPSNETVFKKLAIGDEGDTITYTIKRDSLEKAIPIVLEAYNSPTVELSFKDSIPVIKISEFTSQTSNAAGTFGEFIDYMIDLHDYESIIIDLRNNGGGDGDQCFAIAQEFLSVGDSTVGIISAIPDTITQKQTFDTTFFVNDFDGIARNHYFVFLANGYSASCSEILLASVISNIDYPVVGATTYGKGIGQNNFLTPAYAVAAMTGMKIVDKNFKSYHSVGIKPDFAIFNPQEALDKAVKLAKEKTYRRTAGYGTTNTGHFAKSAVVEDNIPGFYFLPKEMRTDITKRFGK